MSALVAGVVAAVESEPLAYGILGVIGTFLTVGGTVLVAKINRSDARPQPDSVHPSRVPDEQDARIEAWREHSQEMVDRLILAEVEIRELRASDRAKDERIAGDAVEINRLRKSVADLIAYIRVLISELSLSGRTAPQPPPGLDLD